MPQLNFVKQGQGPLVLLSHALGIDLSMWDAVADALSDRYTVLRYDHRGHGRSEVVPGPYTVDQLADDAAALIEREGGGRRAHVVGLSMGGMAAQALAARHPQLVHGLVVANSAMYYDQAARATWSARVQTVQAQGVAAIADGTMQRWFSAEFRADTAGAARVAALRTRFEATDANAYVASCAAVAGVDCRDSNRRLICPTLVIAGTHDEATPPALSEAIRSAIPGAKLATIEAAHLSAAERPGPFARLVSDFVGGLRV